MPKLSELFLLPLARQSIKFTSWRFFPQRLIIKPSRAIRILNEFPRGKNREKVTEEQQRTATRERFIKSRRLKYGSDECARRCDARYVIIILVRTSHSRISFFVLSVHFSKTAFRVFLLRLAVRQRTVAKLTTTEIKKLWSTDRFMSHKT